MSLQAVSGIELQLPRSKVLLNIGSQFDPYIDVLPLNVCSDGTRHVSSWMAFHYLVPLASASLLATWIS